MKIQKDYFRATEQDHGTTVLIPYHGISYVDETCRVIMLNCVHGEGNGIFRIKEFKDFLVWFEARSSFTFISEL